MQSSPSAFIDAPASLNEGLSVVLPGSRLRALVRSRICRSRGAHGSFYRQPPLFRHRPLRCAVTVIPVLYGIGMFPLSEPFLKIRRVSDIGRLTTRQGRRRSALLHGNQRLRDGGWSPFLSSGCPSCYREDSPHCYRVVLPVIETTSPYCHQAAFAVIG